MNARQKAKYYKRIVESTKVKPVIIRKEPLREYQVKTQCDFPSTSNPEEVVSILLNNLMCELKKIVRTHMLSMTADCFDNKKTVYAKFRFWIREREGEE